jgi:hypothetical protein
MATTDAQWTVVVTTRKSAEPGIRDHWAIVFEPVLDVHQITGPKGYFYYIPRGGNGHKLFASTSLLAKVPVGYFPPRDRWKVDAVFKGVSITDESETQSWDCQNWTVEALAALNKANYAVEPLSHIELAARLRAAEESGAAVTIVTA